MNLGKVCKTATFTIVYIGYLILFVYMGMALILLIGTYINYGTAYVGGGPMAWIGLVWLLTIVCQLIFAHWPAFKLLRHQGNKGFILFGWLVALCLASFVPGAGFFLWRRYLKNAGK